MASIKLTGDTSGEITISAPAVAGTNTLTLPASTQTLATQNALGVRNLIINGDMRIAQRGTSGAFGSGVAFITDRWRHYFDTAVTGNITISQSSVAPSNFDYSHLLTNGTATSPASGNFNGCTQRIEGNNVAHLAFGTSDAKTVTLSFWVRSSLTGTFGIALGNGAQNRVMTKTYTISSANTWEYKTLTFVGDTSGTWEKDNTAGMIVYYDVGSGSGEETATLDTWNSTRAIRTSACVRLIENTGATWQITGVQLEISDGEATPFEHRPYDMELQRCQRYCYSMENINVAVVGHMRSTTEVGFAIPMPVSMRAAPSFSYSAVTGTLVQDGSSGSSGSSYNATPSEHNYMTSYLALGLGGSFTNNIGVKVRTNHSTGNNYIWSAEL